MFVTLWHFTGRKNRVHWTRTCMNSSRSRLISALATSPARLLDGWHTLASLLDDGEIPLPFHPGLPAGVTVTIDARLLRPTQSVVGFREVAAKRKNIESKSRRKRVAWLRKKSVPVVIGPGGVPWMVDGHHTLRALVEADVGDKTAFGHILANWSGLDSAVFWRRMRENNYVYLQVPGSRTRLSPARLPVSLLDLQDDPWRSLAWAVGKAGVYEVQNHVFFQKFHWAEFFRVRITWDDSRKKNFRRAVVTAMELACTPAASHLPGWLPSGEADANPEDAETALLATDLELAAALQGV
ncbi:chromosome partitioning protein ParB [Opitutaceae bacterium TAV5]|nr:chromosome partitioning protein ParB [Opitutaceae bacterium TAV5]